LEALLEFWKNYLKIGSFIGIFGKLPENWELYWNIRKTT
jgi:hypothetical protein